MRKSICFADVLFHEILERNFQGSVCEGFLVRQAAEFKLLWVIIIGTPFMGAHVISSKHMKNYFPKSFL